MADDNIVIIDGGWKKLTDLEFEIEYGHKPTSGSSITSERLFNGRYEHSSFVSGSLGANGLVSADDQNIKNPGITVISISGSI
jgi:hypothetical protein